MLSEEDARALKRAIDVLLRQGENAEAAALRQVASRLARRGQAQSASIPGRREVIH
jgi:hypothetical protein